jgi:small subunit ribosomal protein S23
MGRYDFRPLRVRQTAKALYDSKRNRSLPQWYNIVGDIPPGETLARPVLRAPKVRHARKASKLFKPLPITYAEDKLRSDFFGDHPWELARPRLVVEDSGNDAKGYDWSKITQRGKQLDGERYLNMAAVKMPAGTDLGQCCTTPNVAHEARRPFQGISI